MHPNRIVKKTQVHAEERKEGRKIHLFAGVSPLKVSGPPHFDNVGVFFGGGGLYA